MVAGGQVVNQPSSEGQSIVLEVNMNGDEKNVPPESDSSEIPQKKSGLGRHRASQLSHDPSCKSVRVRTVSRPEYERPQSNDPSDGDEDSW